jgi:hypothetical protein
MFYCLVAALQHGLQKMVLVRMRDVQTTKDTKVETRRMQQGGDGWTWRHDAILYPDEAISCVAWTMLL